MKKMITKFLMALMALFVIAPQASAIITDPDDYLWYDSGILGTAESFTFPAWMEHSDKVVFNPDTAYGFSNNRSNDMINKFGTITGERNLLQILGSPSDGTARAILIPKEDSLVLNVPVCDSFYIETWGERGVLVSSDANDTIWYMGYSSNYAGIIRLRYARMDSMRIVIKGAQNDVYSPKKGGDATNMYQANNFDYFEGSNFSAWQRPTLVNRIKIYNKIEKGEVPAFDGTHSGWTCKYRPQTSGTVDLTSVISVGSGWEEQVYKKYASDLGVVRSMLTTSAEGIKLGNDDNFGYAMKITDLYTMADTSDYTLGDQHDNYFQLDFSAAGFQDMTLNFNFNILYGGGDTCVVVYQMAGESAWTVLGKYVKSGDDTEMTSVSVALPDSMANQKGLIFRIMAGNGEYSGNEFVLSHLSIDGYDDYFATDDNAPKVAYISNATDRIHILDRATTADSTDAILKSLMENSAYDVTVFTADKWAGVDTEDEVKALFADYNAVILSEYPGSSSDIAKACQYLIGYKPFLNMKSDAYKNWNKGVTSTDGATDSLANIAASFYYHPIFSSLDIDQTALVTPELFDTIVGTKALQGYTGTQSGYAIATGINSGATCIYEDCTVSSAKYMMFAVSNTNYAHITSKCKTLINNMIKYLCSNSVFVEPNFNMVSTGAIVENTDELKAALAYDYSALNLSEVLIQLKQNTDASGVYALGNNAVNFGGGTLHVEPYDNASAVITGSFSSAKRISVKKLTISDIAFKGSATDASAIIVIKAKDKISNGIVFENCSFSGLTQGLLQASSADSAEIGGLTVTSCQFENIGGEASSAFIQLDKAPYKLDNISFTENVIDRYTGKEFINWERTAYTSTDTVIEISIDHNIFNEYSGNASSAGNFISFANRPEGFNVYININNNLFYGKAAAGPSYGSFNLFTPGEDSCSLVLNRNYFAASGMVSPNVAASWNLLQDNVPEVGSNIFDNADKLLISKASFLYTAGVGRTYVGAISNYSNRTKPATLTVANVPELKTALEIAIGGDVIALENCNDTIDVYLLGNTGFTYPKTSGSLTIKAAAGHSPKLFGRISPINNCELDALTYTGLHFVDSTTFTGYNNTAYSALFFSSAASIGKLTMEKCQFSDMENQYLFRTDKCEGLYIGELAFYNNRLDNFGGSNPNDGKSYGAHFVQYVNSLSYSLDTFIFENNVVTNFHGSQFFNISRNGTTNPDSSICVSICNNLFYKIGGCANSARGFLEFDKVPTGCDVNIDINDNIFYERWSTGYYAVSNLQLFENTDTLNVSVDVKNNFFEGEYYSGDETFGPNPMAQTDATFNLPSTSSTIKVNYVNHPMSRESLGLETVFESIDPFSISKQSALYTAGTNGGYVGPKSVYGVLESVPSVMDSPVANKLYTQNGVLYIQSHEASTVEIFNTIGKLVYKGQIGEGLNSVEGMSAGNLYLVKVGNRTSKVIL